MPFRVIPPGAFSEGPLEIMRARISIEGETAAMAARQMRALQIPELGKALEFEKGEEVEWIVADKAHLILSRQQAGSAAI